MKRRQRAREKQNKTKNNQNNNFACASHLFALFCRFCTTTTRKCLISRFITYGKRKQATTKFYFSF